jgi:ABC-type nitrate/sulfonate/bicarbonate transport system substrate-binding protein
MSFKRIPEIFRAGVIFIFALVSVESSSAEGTDASVPIRIGWQIPAATQGQLVQIIKRTDILHLHGLDPNFVPFSYGGPQVEAAFAGKLDVVFAGDQPAVNLIARGGKWKIVARLFEDRISILVPPDSPITDVKGLRGKTVASAFGSTAHREVFLQQQAVGLDPEKDVRNENFDILEIGRRIQDGGVESWNGFDAAAVWEPFASRFEQEGLAQSLSSKSTLGVVAISEEFIANHPDEAVEFLVVLMRSWDFFALHPDQVMQWYIEDTRLDYTPEALVSARLDLNFSAKSLSEIDLRLKDEDVVALEQAAAWALKAGEGDVRILESIDQSLMDKVEQVLVSAQFEEFKIILPSTGEASLITKESGYFFNAVPLWVLFIMMVLIALLAIESGLYLGRRAKKKFENPSVNPIATVVGAILGMMAFVIALTFGSANNRFDARKTALLNDVTAIQTAYLRANLLPEPHRTTVRSLLRDYVQARVGIVHAYDLPDTLQLVQRRAEVLQGLMWTHVTDLAETGSNGRVLMLFTSALNDVINLHTKRVVIGAYYQIPIFVWITLIVASSVAMFAVGYQFGIGCGRRFLTANLALSITFALVMLLAFDLDRTGDGLVSVNQQPMFDLYKSMHDRSSLWY